MSVWPGPLYLELPILPCSGFSGGCSHGSVKSKLLKADRCGGGGDLRSRGGSGAVWCGNGLFK